jgi:hypothetical protein
MGELEPPTFVVPTPVVVALALEPEFLSIEVENFQEDFDRELGNRYYVTSGGQVTTAGRSSLSVGKLGTSTCQAAENTVAEEILR